MADREMVIKGLECCTKWDSCSDCPYQTPNEYDVSECTEQMHKDTLALLKEQEAVVHCGDCENFCFDNISPNAGRCMLTNMSHSKTWFCAHGKREEGR